MKNKFISALLSATTLILCVSCGWSSDKSGNSSGARKETVDESILYPWGFNPDTLSVKEGVVKNGQYFSTLLNSLGMGASEVYSLTTACDSVFNVRSFRVGNAYKAYYETSTMDEQEHTQTLRYLVYERDRRHQVIFDCRSPYRAWVYEKPIEYVDRYAEVTIDSSLWNDMRAAGAPTLLILSLSDIYAWTVDFFGLQKGDQFKVLYQEQVCDGEVIAVDTVRYAVFTHSGHDFPAIMFDQGDGGNLWWNEKGESMRKAFLKAPLHYSRISSGFTHARKHPITRKVQPHTGVDYAAPKGTPVMTIGDGVVVDIYRTAAGGNSIKIRHNSVYTTAYLHLNGYAKGLKEGQRVKQGDVIGYVGSTGRSTGPHLDFRVWKNGTPINPLTMDSPPSEPLRSENMPAFESAIQTYKEMIAEIVSTEQ